LAIGFLSLLHASLILATEGLSAIFLNIENWPELMGVCLLFSIVTIVVISWWRQSLGLVYHRWWLVHRIGTPLAVIALAVHILFVNDTFKYGFPRTLIFSVIGCYVLLYAWLQIKRFFIKGKPYEVLRITKAAQDTYCIELGARKNQHLDYIPGQFAFVSFTSPLVSREEHPFTISSTPSRAPNLQFTIRSCGDWTNTISRLRPEDRAFISGPFGNFGHIRFPQSREFIMVAGGIGITPILSMLRFMADVNDNRKVTLIWSNRTRKHIVYPDEFLEIEERLAGLSIIHVLTREPSYDGEKGRLDEVKFEKLFSGCSRQSTVFTCGPPDMLKDTYRALRSMGFPRRSIIMERFSL
jgi:predicted ferric reductase